MSLVSQISALAARIREEILLRGAPAGGSAGQVLRKLSADDFDYAWRTPEASGGGVDLPEPGADGEVMTVVGGEWLSAPAAGGGGADADALHFRGDWNPTHAYLKSDVVRVGEAYYVAKEDVAAGAGNASTQFVGQTAALGNGSAATIALPAGVALGDVLLLVLTAGSAGGTKPALSGWTLLGTASSSGNSRMTVMYRVHDGSPAPILPVVASNHQWMLRAFRNVGTPVWLTPALNTGLGPALSGLTCDFVTRIVGANDSGTYTASPALLNYYAPSHSFIGLAAGDQNVAGGAAAAVQFGTGSFTPFAGGGNYGVVSVGYTVTGTFDPGSRWDLLSRTAPAIQTAVLADIAGDGTFDLAPAFTILSVAYSGAGRLRLYRTPAGRATDAGRAFTTSYTSGAGLLYDYLATGAETDIERPVDGAYGAGESSIYYAADGPVTATLTWIQTGA